MFDRSKQDDKSLEDVDINAFKEASYEARMRSKSNKSQLDELIFGERMMGDRSELGRRTAKNVT